MDARRGDAWFHFRKNRVGHTAVLGVLLRPRGAGAGTRSRQVQLAQFVIEHCVAAADAELVAFEEM